MKSRAVTRLLPGLALALLASGAMGAARGQSDAQSDNAQPPPDRAGDATPSKSPIAPMLPPGGTAPGWFLDTHPFQQSSSADDATTNTLTVAPPLSETPPAVPEEMPTPAPNNFAVVTGNNPNQLAAHLLVVYNTDDPDSKSLAQYYASRRHIADDHVLGIACPLQEQITRAQYESTVREPITSYIFAQHWMERRSALVRVGDQNRTLLLATRNDIWAIVLMRGIPLRIANDPTVEGQMEHLPALSSNAAAVDSELALLPVFGLPPGGFVPNIFYDATGSGLVRAGPDLATKIVLVTRLDGPQPSDVRRMIDDSLYAERNRLVGLAVIDSRGLTGVQNNYAIGDDWLRHSRDMLAHDGWPIRFDERPEVLPPTDPLNHVALYLGWYRDVAYGPWVTAPNRFVRGAIAYHLHSFSAVTVRSDHAAWVGPLIAHGAAATMGCVYEPYLDLTPHLDIFTRRLLEGNSFAEAAYASQKGLSWMVTVVGDPLYRPFLRSVDSALAASDSTTSDRYGWLLLQQVKRGLVRGDVPDEIPSLEHYLDIDNAVAQEGLGDLLEKLGDASADEAAVHAYRQAAALDTQPVDHIRVSLKLARQYGRSGNDDDERNALHSLWTLYPAEARTFGVPTPHTTGEVSLDTMPFSTATALTTPTATINPGVLPAPPRPPKPPKPVARDEDSP